MIILFHVFCSDIVRNIHNILYGKFPHLRHGERPYAEDINTISFRTTHGIRSIFVGRLKDKKWKLTNRANIIRSGSLNSMCIIMEYVTSIRTGEVIMSFQEWWRRSEDRSNGEYTAYFYENLQETSSSAIVW